MMKFTKMQGCGNDYVYVDCFSERVPDPSALAQIIADRHYGVGGDGLILIEPAPGADARMRMFNADGSEGAMCGNGIRCVAKYLYDHGLVPADRRSVAIETKAGRRGVELFVEGGRVAAATADMGKAALTGEGTISIRGMTLSFMGVDMGNPHAVYFLEDNPALNTANVADLPLEKYGPVLEKHQRFPDRVNSEFVEIVNRGEVRLRVWERGAGETLACGTGATSAAFAGMTAGKLDDTVLVHLRGGDLQIRYDRSTRHCFMTGPAVEVFTGDFPS